MTSTGDSSPYVSTSSATLSFLHTTVKTDDDTTGLNVGLVFGLIMLALIIVTTSVFIVCYTKRRRLWRMNEEAVVPTADANNSVIMGSTPEQFGSTTATLTSIAEDFKQTSPNIGAESTGPSIGLVVGLVAMSLAVIAGVVIVIVVVVRRRRLKLSDKTRRKNSSPIHPFTERSTWHDENAEKAEIQKHMSDDQETYQDIELQPTFSISGHHLIMNNEELDGVDNGKTIKTDSQQLITRNSDDYKDSVVFDSKSKSFKVKASDIVHISENLNNTAEEKHIAHDRDGGEYYTLVERVLKPAEQINTSTITKRVAIEIEANNEEVDTTSKAIVDDYLTENGENVALHQEDDEIYANNESIILSQMDSDIDPTTGNWKRNNSMVENINKEERNVSTPRRAASEMLRQHGGESNRSVRPPIAQPRLSKKKIIDPYDYLPRFPIPPGNIQTLGGIAQSDATHNDRETESIDSVDKKGTGNARNDSHNDDTVHDNDDNSGDMYDYPRNNDPVRLDTAEDESNSDLIYDVPNSIAENN